MQNAGKLHPAVRGLLSHPAAKVRRRAIAMLDEAGDAGAVPLVQPLLKDPDFDTRTEALLFLAHHANVDPLQQIRVGDFPEYSVQAGMVAFLSRPGPLQNLDAAGFLLDNLIDEQAGATTESRLEASRLLARLPDSFEPQLGRLLSDHGSRGAPRRHPCRRRGGHHRVRTAPDRTARRTGLQRRSGRRAGGAR